MQEEETKETIIELEEEVVEEAAETEEPQQESEPETQVEPEQESEPEVEASAEEGEQSDEELESYSEGVQRRIRKLTAKYREEERQKQAAVEFAENVQKQNKDLEKQLKEREESYVGVYGGSIEREVEAAKAAYKAAHEEGDPEALFAAQQRISQLALEQSRYEEAKLKIEKEQAAAEQAVETPQQQAPCLLYTSPSPRD